MRDGRRQSTGLVSVYLLYYLSVTMSTKPTLRLYDILSYFEIHGFNFLVQKCLPMYGFRYIFKCLREKENGKKYMVHHCLGYPNIYSTACCGWCPDGSGPGCLPNATGSMWYPSGVDFTLQVREAIYLSASSTMFVYI